LNKDIINIRTQTLADLENFFKEQGGERFRARQVYEWLWKKTARSFGQMTDISLKTRDLLKQHYTVNAYPFRDQDDSMHFFPGRLQPGLQVLCNRNDPLCQEPLF
jgi:adenine C2-methylase RlmN of 23S rRNA A2503 and tRNA A37